MDTVVRSVRLGLGLAAALVANERCMAQVMGPAHVIHPGEAVMATQTPAAGRFRLDMIDGVARDAYGVYVPPRCVGATRCPLLVFVASPFQARHDLLGLHRQGADEYGIIVFVAAADHGDSLGAYSDRGGQGPQLKEFNLALQHVFRNFAIDPDKIAILGRCASGGPAIIWGSNNPEMFSRIVLNSTISALPNWPLVPWKNKAAEFLLINGLREDGFTSMQEEWAEIFQRDGHRTKLALGFRTHDHQWEDYYFVLRWLHESWTEADPAKRPAPRVAADPPPVLTVEVVKQMTAFWTRFMQEPDSIRTAARRAHLQEVLVPVGPEPRSILMMDVAALAARYPSVTAGLHHAGLTAQQHDAYRVALASAELVNTMRKFVEDTNRGRWGGQKVPSPSDTLIAAAAHKVIRSIPASSPLGRNIEFLRAHPDELAALDATGIWVTP